ncbi:UNVERIFIED_CONTAM: hypothetical protein Sindi_1816100 [Sesamum indicum]
MYADDNEGEGNGAGDDDEIGVSDYDHGVSEWEGDDESDSLEDSEYDGEGDDSDGCGDEESGQEEVESSYKEDTTSSDDVCSSGDDFDSVAGSDEEKKEPHHVFISGNKYDPHFEIGMLFSNKIELREAIHNHAVCTKRSLKIFKNDKRRVYVKCLGDGCPWIMHVLKFREESTFRIRQYNPTHKCARSFNVKNVNSKWLSTKYEDAFRTDPKRNVKGFRKDVIKELRCHTYDRVDGWHLKGPYGGVLLTAISIDPNNNLYPLAYAVVSGETREAWQWFFELLKDDLHIVRDDTYTFISDKQKGLIPAFESVFPGADNRFCVRHLHDNMKTAGFRGLAFKKALWSAAKATTMSEFNFRMEEFAKLDPKLVEWLSDKPPAHWSRAHFNCFPKCDMLLNNICETFNGSILEAREKPIMTMLEWIRKWIMNRLSELRDRARKKWQDKKICLKIRKIVEKNIDKAADCIPIKSDDWHYEVSCYDGARKWDLTGIPCKHGMSAICTQSLEPEDFVNPCYSVATFIEVYKHAILPVNGPKVWEKRRPARARRLEYGEPANKGKKRTRGQRNQITKMKRQPYKVKCHYCGETSHNKKGCARKKKDQPVTSMQLTVIEKAPQKTTRKSTRKSMKQGQMKQVSANSDSRRLTRSMFIESSSEPNLATSQSNTTGMTSEHMLHNFTQCSKVNQSSVSGVPCLTKGGNNFVTMINLSAVLDAIKKKKKKITKKAK